VQQVDSLRNRHRDSSRKRPRNRGSNNNLAHRIGVASPDAAAFLALQQPAVSV